MIPDWLADSLHRASLAVAESEIVDNRESRDRRRWREYACAGLASGASRHFSANQADEMLKLERERFEPKESP